MLNVLLKLCLGVLYEQVLQPVVVLLYQNSGMAKPLVPDDLWTLVEPLLPPVPNRTFGGRPRISNRAALGGILFVFKTGIQWKMLPLEMGCGSGTTCWRRLRDWQQAGVWQKLHETLLTKLDDAGYIDTK